LFIDKKVFTGKPEGKWRPFNSYYINGSAYGGLIGTPLALASYAQDLLQPESKLLSVYGKQLMFTENFAIDGKPTGMCLSWFKGSLQGNTYYCHAGGGGGYYSEIRIYPKAGCASLVIFNRTGVSDERFLDKLDRFYFESNGPAT
jgi:hypothetical protein